MRSSCVGLLVAMTTGGCVTGEVLPKSKGASGGVAGANGAHTGGTASVLGNQGGQPNTSSAPIGGASSSVETTVAGTSNGGAASVGGFGTESSGGGVTATSTTSSGGTTALGGAANAGGATAKGNLRPLGQTDMWDGAPALPCFTVPSTNTFTMLMTGWVLNLRRHTITEVVRAAGAVGCKHISSFHRFFSR